MERVRQAGAEGTLLVGAYAALPPPSEAEACPKVDEEAFFRALREMPAIGGLEIPFYGSGQVASELHPDWQNVLTCLPGTMQRHARDPAFGLASMDERGRRDAVELVAQARLATLGLLKRLGPASVQAVEIHSAPRRGPRGQKSSSSALARSLVEIRSWDWSGVRLLLEHCDAWVSEHPSAKGFLTLTEEIDAIRASQRKGLADCGLAINWGRSAIEARSAEGPIRHLREARSQGLLELLVFSGCTPSDPLYGEWADAHAPMGGNSLLSVAEVKRSLAVLRESDPWGTSCRVGMKMQILPQTAGTDERVAMLERWVADIISALEHPSKV